MLENNPAVPTQEILEAAHQKNLTRLSELKSQGVSFFSVLCGVLNEIRKREGQAFAGFNRIAHILLDYIDDYNQVDKDGFGLLHYASRGASALIVELLLKRGAVVDGVRLSIPTPLQIVVMDVVSQDKCPLNDERKKIVKALLGSGANKDRMPHGTLSAYLAAQNHPELKALMEAPRPCVHDSLVSASLRTAGQFAVRPQTASQSPSARKELLGKPPICPRIRPMTASSEAASSSSDQSVADKLAAAMSTTLRMNHR